MVSPPRRGSARYGPTSLRRGPSAGRCVLPVPRHFKSAAPVTAVDARTGEFVVFDSAGEAGLVDAVGARVALMRPGPGNGRSGRGPDSLAGR